LTENTSQFCARGGRGCHHACCVLVCARENEMEKEGESERERESRREMKGRKRRRQRKCVGEGARGRAGRVTHLIDAVEQHVV
jgi:hypothetical protein